MWAYVTFLACAVLIFAVPVLIVHSIKGYKRWRLESAVYNATACKPWIGKDNLKTEPCILDDDDYLSVYYRNM